MFFGLSWGKKKLGLPNRKIYAGLWHPGKDIIAELKSSLRCLQHLLVFHLYKSCFMGTWIDRQLLTLVTDEQREKKLGWVHQYLGLGWVPGHIPLTRWRLESEDQHPGQGIWHFPYFPQA